MGAKPQNQETTKQVHKPTPKPEPQQPEMAEVQFGQEPLELLLQRAQQDPDSISPSDSSRIQRSIGNQAYNNLSNNSTSVAAKNSSSNSLQAIVGHVSSLSRKNTVQTKLEVNEVDDSHEQEADAVAEAVMRMPVSTPPPPPADNPSTDNTNGTIPTVQRSSDNDPGGSEVTPEVESRVGSLNGKGSSLPDQDREFFESRIGADFSGVRVHTGSEAEGLSQDLNARAFTVGNDIAFNKGEYQPGSHDGRKLLAHELTHTIQQGAAQPVQPKQAIQRRALTVDPPPAPAPVEMTPEEQQTLEMGKEPESERENADASESNEATSDQFIEGEEETAVSPTDTLAQDNNKKAPAEQAAKEAPTDEAPLAEDAETAEPQDDKKDASALPAENGKKNEAEGKEKDKSKDKQPAAKKENKAKAEGALTTVAGDAETAKADNQAKSASLTEEAAAGKDEQASKTADAKNRAQEAATEVNNVASKFANLESTAGSTLAPPDHDAIHSEVMGIIQMKKNNGGSGDLSAQGNAMISSFVAGLSAQAMQLTAQSSTISGSIMPSVQAAQAQIQAAMAENQNVITTTITEANALVEVDAESARSELQAQYDTTLAEVELSSQTAREQVATEHQAKLDALTGLQTGKQGDVDTAFSNAQSGIRGAAQAAAAEANGKADGVVAIYESKQYPEPSFFDGADFPDRKRKAATDAAKSTAQGYHDELIAKGEETAGQIDASKPDALAEIENKIAATRQLIEQEQIAALEEVEAAHQESLAQAEELLTSQNQVVDQTQESTLTSLAELEQRLQTQLAQTSEQQILAVEESGQQIIASIQESIAQTAAGAESGIQGLLGQLSGKPAPDLDTLSSALNGAKAEFGGALGKAQSGITEQISLAHTTLAEQAVQSVEAINDFSVQATEQATPISDDFTTSISDLITQASESFTEIQTGHTESTTTRVETAVTRFEEAYTQCETELTEVITALNNGLNQYIEDFKSGEGGLNETVAKAEPHCAEEAEKAESKVQPAWKKVVATILTVIITIVVAVAIAALVASGIGFVAGLLIAAGIGALGGVAKGMLSNWSEGEDLTKDIVQHAVSGAIDGMLQFAGGRFIKSLSLPDVGLKKLATEAATDTVTGAVTEIATLGIQGQLTMDTALSAIAGSLISGVFSVGSGRLTEGLTDGLDDGIRKTITEQGVEFVSGTAEGITQSVAKGEPIDMGQILLESTTQSVVSGGMQHYKVEERLTVGIDNVNDRIGGGSSGSSSTPADITPDMSTPEIDTPDVTGNVDTPDVPTPDTDTPDIDTPAPITDTPDIGTPDVSDTPTPDVDTDPTPDMTNDVTPSDASPVIVPPENSTAPNSNRDNDPQDPSNNQGDSNQTTPNQNRDLPDDVKQILNDAGVDLNDVDALLQAGMDANDIGLLALESGQEGITEKLQFLSETQDGGDLIYLEEGQHFITPEQAQFTQQVDDALVVALIDHLRDTAPGVDPNTNIVFDRPRDDFIDPYYGESYGYYDPETQQLYINTHIPGWQETTIHEAIHMLSDTGREPVNINGEAVHNIGLAQNIYDTNDHYIETRFTGINEGFTELMTQQIAGDMGMTNITPAYTDQVTIAQALGDKIGMDVVRDYYFAGDTDGLRTAVDAQLGAGAFDLISQLSGNGGGVDPYDLRDALHIIDNGMSSQNENTNNPTNNSDADNNRSDNLTDGEIQERRQIVPENATTEQAERIREITDQLGLDPDGHAGLSRFLENSSPLDAAIENTKMLADELLGRPFVDFAYDLPEAYTFYTTEDGTFVIRRNAGESDDWPPLTIDANNNITIGDASQSNRISVSGKLATALGGPKVDHQAHHLIPDAVVRDHPLTQLAISKGLYDLDRASNGIMLPDNAAGKQVSPDLPLHNGSHPEWNRIASERLDAILTRLERKYDGDLSNVPDDVLLVELAKAETQLREQILILEEMH